MTDKDLPQRFRESSFRDYEPHIHSVLVANLVGSVAIRFNPKHFNKSMATFACRFRDAMRSFKDHSWESYIDKDHFERIYPTLKVSERSDGSVLVGTAQAISSFVNTNSNGVPLSQPINTDPEFMIDMSTDAFTILACLSAARLLAPRIKLARISAEKVAELQANFDIAIDKNEDGTFTLI